MDYSQLSEVYDQLSKTSKRLEKINILAKFLKTLSDDESEINHIILLLQGRVFPLWDKRKTGVASKIVLQSLALASGLTLQKIETILNKKGDIGDATEEILSNKTQSTLFSESLSVEKVFSNLVKLSSIEGTGTVDSKVKLIAELLTSASSLEGKFIVRTVVEDLRVGVAEGTLRDSIVLAFYDCATYNIETNQYDFKTSRENFNEQINEVQHAYDLSTDFAKVIIAIKNNSLDKIKLNVLTPLKLMLARKEKAIEKAFDRTGLPVRLEYKYDGFRLQIHKKDDEVKLFTRRFEDVTEQFPEIVQNVKKHVKSNECILDAEAVGFDPITKKYQPFQHISQRIRRKYDVKDLAEKLPCELCVFDVLLNDGELLLNLPLIERLKILQNMLESIDQKIIFASGIEVDSVEKADEFYKESLSAGNEGIMIKDLNAIYKPGARVTAWIKMKPIMDELDLVITKAEWGTGKRSDWITSFTLACVDDYGNFLEIGKVGTGLKELKEEGLSFEELTERLKPLILKTEGKIVTVKPEIVVMVAYEEIQKSTTYSSGYALRFPRVLRLRDDRKAEFASTLDDVEELFDSQ